MSTHTHHGHDHHDHHDHHEDHEHAAHEDHSHGPGGHHHHHAPQAGQGRTFALAVGLNVLIVVVQAVYGLLAHSTALLADAGHNLSDVLGLLLAWGAVWLGTRRPSARYTFGLGSSSILASLANAALLLLACGAILLEAIQRLLNPAPVAGLDVFIVAMLGLVVNGFSAWLFMRGSKEDLNVRGAFMHMAGDAAISAAVGVSGLAIIYTGWYWLDPVMSIVVVAVILYGTWDLGRDAMRLALAAVPPGVDTGRIRGYLSGLPGVRGVHDLHVWALSTTENALTVHLVMPQGHPGDAFMQGVVATLRRDYAMHHSTVQVDVADGCSECVLQHR
ncbi:cation diffusion facilitator family transporter [Caballeronia sp. LZ062]|uniref:cation diffusion facilitator family transporter n=1 Tax=unclassified Caballeronia TaxID=2646786 RepID=UPI00285A9A59|nr:MULTISPECIES: cation diffusion facilitator family transporter [unclassified Caballeronia]MDR5855114.1 cation diffusion facilitator family transporter [Caballeronia sp. LZ050]MDR5870356.1 cation diffusion facilitator family transporter [Caballeronia sp. LZ062]